MRGRWLIVLATAVALVVLPLLVAVRPVRDSAITATELRQRIADSGEAGWSGVVRTAGGLSPPDTDSFANLAELLGESLELRVWWRGSEDWRVDQIRSTGETGLYHDHAVTVRWQFEAQRAVVSPTPSVRLPQVSDLLPATLGRGLLDGAAPAELSRLPARRVAGTRAAGLRLIPASAATSLRRVDVWADEATGLPMRVEVYGADGRRPVLTTAVVQLNPATPDPARTRFNPPPSVELAWEPSVDVAAEANALTDVDLPALLAGLPAANGDPGPVGRYGSGVASLIVVPLRREVSRPLRAQLRDSPAATDTPYGTGLAVGPIGLLLTRRSEQGSFLLAGTVTPEQLQRSAAELVGPR